MSLNIKNLAIDLDCIYVLSGGMRKNQNGEIVPGDFETLDHHGFMAEGQTRCQAAVHLWQQNKQIKVISSGTILPLTKDKDSEKAPYSAVYKNEMIKLGIAPESIIESTEPIDTFSELVSLVGFITQNTWKNIVVICNRAQMARTLILWKIIQDYPLTTKLNPDFEISVKFFANRLLYRKEQILTLDFLNKLNKLKTLNPKLTFLASEEVIEYFEPDKKALFETKYKTEKVQKRLKVEEIGIADILNGVYYIPKTVLKK
jgi:hypothetical protein